MRLPRILRTTSFRFVLLYAGLFCASVLLLFVAMGWFGSGYVAKTIDKTISNEIAEIENKAGGTNIDSLRAAIAGYSKDAPPGIYYLLQDRGGRILAGNMPSLSPILGIRSWPAWENGKPHFPLGNHSVRGQGVRVDDGGYLFVGVDSREIDEMREMVMRAFLWGILGTIALSLIGGTIMSLGLLGRVEAISQTSREIVAGDLTKRVQLRGTDDEFDRLAASLNEMLDRIKGLMEGLQEVSSDIAHDLRTPLSRLRQRLELARRRSSSIEEMQIALDRSIQDVDAILETFGALLRIAQIEARTHAAGIATIDLSGLLSGLVETYQFIAEEHGQTLTANIQEGLMLKADRELLPQLFSNLIENAIRHCPERTKISVQAARIGRDTEMIISDDGPGIPAEMCEKVFQRFFRLERSRTTPGTGLGLSLAAAIARLHDARITLLDNRPGLIVRLVFPTTES